MGAIGGKGCTATIKQVGLNDKGKVENGEYETKGKI